MKDYIEERTLAIARYMIDHHSTVRAAAQVFHLSKSTVHKDLDNRLPQLEPDLALQVQKILAFNKAVRHLRGGEATRQKYRCQR